MKTRKRIRRRKGRRGRRKEIRGKGRRGGGREDEYRRAEAVLCGSIGKIR